MHFPGEDELESFPSISDFDLILRDSDGRGKHIEMVSTRRGRLAGFPAWDHADRDLRHFVPSDVPVGTIDEPYDDADDGWRIQLFEHRGFVYVLEGDSPYTEDFPRCFRVSRRRYLAAWAALIDAHNPIMPLDLESEP
ncbi:MAG TPA: hypothetical protein VM779_15270 [Thermoanaerobaculia bacterium]|nr:hypothetical protein [Thermoanaerobaculia bacterium]